MREQLSRIYVYARENFVGLGSKKKAVRTGNGDKNHGSVRHREYYAYSVDDSQLGVSEMRHQEHCRGDGEIRNEIENQLVLTGLESWKVLRGH